MSNKARRRRPKTDFDDSRSTRRLFTTVLVAVLVVTMAAAVVVKYRRNYFTPTRSGYEGFVVDKWMGHTNSMTGSFPYYRLLVEEDGGSRITVPIDYDIYERVKIGMWIKEKNGAVELKAGPVGSPAAFHARPSTDLATSSDPAHVIGRKRAIPLW